MAGDETTLRQRARHRTVYPKTHFRHLLPGQKNQLAAALATHRLSNFLSDNSANVLASTLWKKTCITVCGEVTLTHSKDDAKLDFSSVIALPRILS